MCHIQVHIHIAMYTCAHTQSHTYITSWYSTYFTHYMGLFSFGSTKLRKSFQVQRPFFFKHTVLQHNVANPNDY